MDREGGGIGIYWPNYVARRALRIARNGFLWLRLVINHFGVSRTPMR